MRDLIPSIRSSKDRTEHPRRAAPRAASTRWLVFTLTCGLGVLLGATGCATQSQPELVCETPQVVMTQKIYQRAESERAARLVRQVEQLSTDLVEAESALVRAESGMRGTHSRADAVSSLAEARIQVERAASRAPWRPGVVAEARAKLADAGKQIDVGHFGAALFFVYRAERLADELESEAEQVYDSPGTRFVAGRRVNLRAGPGTAEPVLSILSEGTPVFPESRQKPWVLVRTAGGAVGWVHGTLLSRR